MKMLRIESASVRGCELKEKKSLDLGGDILSASVRGCELKGRKYAINPLLSQSASVRGCELKEWSENKRICYSGVSLRERL